MVKKKESIKRGYMNKEEVEEHLKDFGDDKEKINYLKKIINKQSLLSEKTRKYVHEITAETLEKSGKLFAAAICYRNAGNPLKAAELYEREGLHQGVAESLSEAGKDKEGAEYLERVGWYEHAATWWEKAGNPEKAKKAKKKHGKTQEKERKDITSRLSLIISLAGLAGAIFFLSPNMTGNAIGNISSATSDWLGAVLLVLGLVGFYCIKK